MKRRAAIFVPVKDETTFSPIWEAYYKRFFDKEDIYYLDFGSTHQINTDCKIIHTDYNILNVVEVIKGLEETYALLLKDYEYVMQTDIDEIIYHKTGLDNFIKNLDVDFVQTKGFELVHLPDKEPAYDPSKGILEQRKYWIREARFYDKILLSNHLISREETYASGNMGFHSSDITGTTNDTNELFDDDLLLLHLHKFDYDTCLKRHLLWAEKKWEGDPMTNWHYKRDTEEGVKDWYFTISKKIGENNEVKMDSRGHHVEMPEELRKSICI